MKELSENASTDIVKSHSGNPWFETIDITIPDVYVEKIKEAYENGHIEDPYAYMSISGIGTQHESWHILVTNSSNNVCQYDIGTCTFGSHAAYINAIENDDALPMDINNHEEYITCIKGKFFFHVPYKRENIENTNDNAGISQSSISIGDTSGTILKLIRICCGFIDFDIKVGTCMAKKNADSTLRYISRLGDRGEIFSANINNNDGFYYFNDYIPFPDDAYTNEIESDYKIQSCSHDKTNFSFVIDTNTPMQFRFPPRIAVKSKCQWDFMSPECGYSGNEYENCGKTIGDCIRRHNLRRFGGFPGCGYGGIALYD